MKHVQNHTRTHSLNDLPKYSQNSALGVNQSALLQTPAAPGSNNARPTYVTVVLVTIAFFPKFDYEMHFF
jgi:hypothetical protein